MTTLSLSIEKQVNPISPSIPLPAVPTPSALDEATFGFSHPPVRPRSVGLVDRIRTYSLK